MQKFQTIPDPDISRKNKKILKKKLAKGIKIFLKKRKTISNNTAPNDIKMSQKTKKIQAEHRKNVIKQGKIKLLHK